MEVNINGQFFPYPLKELMISLKEKHSNSWINVNNLIDDYLDEEGPYYKKLNDFLIKKMESDISFNDISEKEEDEFRLEIEELDQRFKPIIDIITKLKPRERNKLYLKQLESIISSIGNLRKIIFNNTMEKEIWNENDSLINSYLNYYSGILQIFINDLKKQQKNKSEKNIFIYNIIISIYSAVILAFLNDNLPNNVLTLRLSELSLLSDGTINKMHKKSKNIINKSLEVEPCPK